MALLTTVLAASAGCAHIQQPERKVYVISSNAIDVGSNNESGTGGSGAEAYCNELEKKCFKTCWNRKPKLSSIPKGSGRHNEYCTELCRQEFMNCVKQQEELERQESQKKDLYFRDMDSALDWIRNHTEEAPPGTTVVVTGVVFVVAVMAGALVLSPL
ncbi:hypothetical protein [Stigmatella ashevillensis]|nr:hypothetical protein [Stigmatella ashevillena]